MDQAASFFCEDPRGPKLMAFYLSLGERFQAGDAKMVEQVQLLMEKIDTIKNVVAQQHNYTSNVYQSEVVTLPEMIDTAVTILREGMDNQGVELHKRLVSKSDNYRLVNVWATWCVPCVEELDELVTIHRMYRNRDFDVDNGNDFDFTSIMIGLRRPI